MAQSNSYPRDPVIKDKDVFSGTQFATLRTVNFTAQAVADYLNINGKISIGGQMTFKFVTLTPGNGTISFPLGGGDNTPFSAITNLVVSTTDMSTQNVVNFLNYIVGSEILLTEQSHISTFGNYRITGYAITANPNFYDLTLEYVGGFGNITQDLYYDLTFFRTEGSTPPVIPTKTSDLINDGEDGIHPFITAQDIPDALIFTSPLLDTAGTITINQSGLATDGYLSSTDWNTFNGKENVLTFSSPLVRTIDAISIPKASGGVNGYLAGPDWLIFNGKQDALLGTGFVKSTAGVISYDTNTYYLASNPDGFITSAALTGYVPYTGATQAVNLGAYNLTVNNISVGKGSGTGTGNTAVGGNALLSNTTGEYNSAFGSASAISNTTGSSNTSIGALSLQLNTTGNGNSAIGRNSLSKNTTGNSNTAVGTSSLNNNTTGAVNVAIGSDSLFNNTTGFYNSTLGVSSLVGNTTGSNNSAFGYEAGRYIADKATSATILNNSLMLGWRTSPLANNQTNQIVIGYDAIGAGSNTVTLGNTSIITTRLRGDIQGGAFVKDGGTSLQYLMADGSVSTGPSLTGYVPTTTTLTINGTTYDLSANRTWSVGTVTSVGLTMPVAFSVSNSPITGAGDIAVTAVGTSAQYIRGDGQLATFPTSGGGGSSVTYYLNGSVPSSVAGYQQMDNDAIIGLGTDFNLVGNGLIAQFLTDAGNPNRIEIPGGGWNFEMYFNISSVGGNTKFYIDLLKYDGSTFTLISSGSANPEEITGGTSVDLYLTSLAVPTTPLLITDRLAIRVYIVDNSGGRTVTLHTEDNNLCEIITTFSSGVASLNGLTASTQYFAVGTSGMDFNISSLVDTHTFNLPTASAVNRGALSSADWTAFNSKFNLPSLTSGSVLFSNGTTIAQDNANFFWDDTNNRLGIGIAIPSQSLEVNGNALIKTAFIGTISAFGDNYASFSHASRNGTSDYSLLSDNSGITYINASATKSINFRINNQDQAILDSNGNVGIGTTNPTSKLNVDGEISINNNHAIRLGANQGGGATLSYQSNGNLNIEPRDGYNTIFTRGNVGIGTTNPGNKLEVAGGITVNNAGNKTYLSDGRIIFEGRTTDGGIAATGSAITNTTLGLIFRMGTIQAAVISPTGNVGIGTTAPGYKLDVSGITRTSNDASNRGGTLISTKDIGGAVYLYNDNGSNTGAVRMMSSYLNGGTLYNPNFSIDRSTNSVAYGGNVESLTYVSSLVIDGSNGNVGIGTTSPSEKLEVQNGTAGAKIKVSNTGGGYAMLECSSNATSNATLSFTNQLALIGGNVGIGTTNPQKPLHVYGDIMLESSGGTETIWMSGGSAIRYSGGFLTLQNSISIDSGNGYVGIGIAIASTALDVNGVITATGGNSTSWNAKENPLTFSSPLVRTVNTISIPKASGGVNGYLAGPDWLVFDGKQDAITLTTTGTSGAATLVGSALNIPQYSGGGSSLSGIHSFVKPEPGRSTGALILPTITVTASTASRLIVYPYIPAQSITCSSLYIVITTLIAGSNTRILIYSSLNGLPNTKLYESANLDSSTTGVKTAITTQTFNAGTTYWIGVHTSANQSMSAISLAGTLNISLSGASASNAVYITPSFGSAPTTFGTPTYFSGNVQLVGITI